MKNCELFLLQHDQTEKERTAAVRLRVSSGKPASEQVMFTEDVTAVTDPEFKLPLFLELKTQSFSHLRVNKLRVFTKPAFWNTPLVHSGGFRWILWKWVRVTQPLHWMFVDEDYDEKIFVNEPFSRTKTT